MAKIEADPRTVNNLPLAFVSDRLAEMGRHDVAMTLRGITYAVTTGRLHGKAEARLRKMSNYQLLRKAEAMSSKVSVMADVPKYLNATMKVS